MTPSDSSLAVFVVQAIGAALVAVALLATATRYDRAFLRSWAISSGALAAFVLSSALSLSLLQSPAEPVALRGVAAAVAVGSKWVQGIWLLVGLRELLDGSTWMTRRRTMWTGLAILAGSIGLVIVSLPAPVGTQYLLRYIVPELLCVVTYGYAAWRMRGMARGSGGIGSWLLAATFALLAIEELRHNVLLVTDSLAGVVPIDLDWLGFVDLFLGAGLGVGALTLLLEEEGTRRAAIAERAQTALEALSESERRQRLVLEHIDEVIWSFGRDAAGRLRLNSLSGRVRSILGHEPEYLLEHPEQLRLLVHPDDIARVEEAWSRIAHTRQPGWYEYRVRTGDAQDRWIEDRVSPQFDGAGHVSGIFGVSRDVTERKRAEEALRRSEEQALQGQKMEAVGRLAGGIAHDFNNVLTVIAGHTDLLLETLPEDDPRRPDAQAISKAAERAAALVRQLLVFSRRQMLHPQVLDLCELIGDLQAMLTRLIGEDIRLSLAAEPGVGRVRADRSQIEQVVVNLVVNARDAMPEGGGVVLEVRDSGVRDDPVLERLRAPAGRYVVLTVQDTGSGISPEAQQRLFEPFFTTKESGKGTGLGLATVYGIVRQSGGHIDVRSEAGRGASFSIYLPRFDADRSLDAPGAVDGGAAEGTLPTTPRVMLVVEDEDAVRSFVVAALQSRGHVVLQAPRGDAALALAQTHEGAIDLLLTDVVMPGMRGSELAARLTEIRPETRVAFMTGYTDDATWRVAQASGHVVLAKPFTSDGLLRAVHDALARRPGENAVAAHEGGTQGSHG